jgi:hypothetical protein
MYLIAIIRKCGPRSWMLNFGFISQYLALDATAVICSGGQPLGDGVEGGRQIRTPPPLPEARELL